MVRKPSWWNSSHLRSYVSVLTNWKWDFCLRWRNEKKKKKSFYTPSAKCPWDMTSPGLITGYGSISVEWCKWWQIPSSLIMHVQLIGVTHRDGHVLALGWGGELPDWIIQKWPVIGLSGCSALSSGWGLRPLAFRGIAHLSLLQCVWWLKHYSHLSQG